MSQLPPDFVELEPLCERWCLPDSMARSAARVASSMEDIQSFYTYMAPRAESALTLLSVRQLGELTQPEENLLKLLLSLAEIGPAVEWFGQPRVIDGYEENNFPLVLAIPDTAAQSTS